MRDNTPGWLGFVGPVSRLPLPELTPKEADAARARPLEVARSLPPWTPQLPAWRRGDKATGRDPEAVRVLGEPKRLAEQP